MGRIREFDSLRGIAAVAVLSHHCLLKGFYYSGLAVNLFFVLSGYLITRIIIERMGEDRFLFNFYARRSLRIWPIYYLTLFFLIGINLTMTGPRYPMGGGPYFLAYLQYLPYYWHEPQPEFLNPTWVGHTWTLAIEEQYYLIWPALILVVGRRGVPATCAAVIAIALAARGHRLAPQLLLTQCDSLALGSLLAWVLVDGVRVDRRRRALNRAFGGLTAAGAALTLAVYNGLIDWGVTTKDWGDWHPASLLILNLTFTGLVGLVVLQAGHPWLAILRHRSLCYLGQISYGFYLYHVPLLTFARTFIMTHIIPYNASRQTSYGLTMMGIVFVLTLATAAASWEWVEKPFLGLKGPFRYHRGPKTEG